MSMILKGCWKNSIILTQGCQKSGPPANCGSPKIFNPYHVENAILSRHQSWTKYRLVRQICSSHHIFPTTCSWSRFFGLDLFSIAKFQCLTNIMFVFYFAFRGLDWSVLNLTGSNLTLIWKSLATPVLIDLEQLFTSLKSCGLRCPCGVKKKNNEQTAYLIC